MHIIDTHCHLDLPAFDTDRTRVLTNARSLGVNAIVVPGIDATGWPNLLGLCSAHADLYPALGLHPMFLDQHQESDLDELEQRLAIERPLAVGEIGLDFFIQEPDRERQLRLFEAQLALARDAGLPVLLHIRKAHDQVLSALRRIQVVGGIAHAFNGSIQQADQFIDLGFRLGFGGMLTFERSTRLRRLARNLPLEALVLETDAPDMTVAAHRGKRNSPEYLPDCLAALAQVRDESPQALAAATSTNARAVLGLPPTKDELT